MLKLKTYYREHHGEWLEMKRRILKTYFPNKEVREILSHGMVDLHIELTKQEIGQFTERLRPINLVNQQFQWSGPSDAEQPLAIFSLDPLPSPIFEQDSLNDQDQFGCDFEYALYYIAK